jgi:hypothetical protein
MPSRTGGKEFTDNSASSSTAVTGTNTKRGSRDTVRPPVIIALTASLGQSVGQRHPGTSAITKILTHRIDDFTKATGGDFVARNKLQAGSGRNGWHLALIKALALLQKGKIPLLLAVESGNQSMCRELLGQQTADQLKATTDSGDAAIHLAARRRDVDMVKILVDYGTNVDMQNVSTAVNISLLMLHVVVYFLSSCIYIAVSEPLHCNGEAPLSYYQCHKNWSLCNS